MRDQMLPYAHSCFHHHHHHHSLPLSLLPLSPPPTAQHPGKCPGFFGPANAHASQAREIWPWTTASTDSTTTTSRTARRRGNRAPPSELHSGSTPHRPLHRFFAAPRRATSPTSPSSSALVATSALSPHRCAPPPPRLPPQHLPPPPPIFDNPHHFKNPTGALLTTASCLTIYLCPLFWQPCLFENPWVPVLTTVPIQKPNHTIWKPTGAYFGNSAHLTMQLHLFQQSSHLCFNNATAFALTMMPFWKSNCTIFSQLPTRWAIDEIIGSKEHMNAKAHKIIDSKECINVEFCEIIGSKEYMNI